MGEQYQDLGPCLEGVSAYDDAPGEDMYFAAGGGSDAFSPVFAPEADVAHEEGAIDQLHGNAPTPALDMSPAGEPQDTAHAVFRMPTTVLKKVQGTYRYVSVGGGISDQGRESALEYVRERPERQALVEQLVPLQNREGVDFDAVDNFFNVLGIPDANSASAIVIDGQYVDEVKAALGMDEHLEAVGESTEMRFGGMHACGLDMTLVVRDPEREAVNQGGHMTEEHVFHEKLHERGTHAYLMQPGKFSPDVPRSVVSTRMGYSLPKLVPGNEQFKIHSHAGGVVEEAVITYLQKLYSQDRNASPNGLCGGEEQEYTYITFPDDIDTENIGLVQVPLRYLNVNPDNPNGFRELNPRSLGGAAAELLVRLEPKLLDAFIDARKGPEDGLDIVGLRATARLLDEIEPRLHDRLMKLDEEGKDNGMERMFRIGCKIAQERGLKDSMWSGNWEALKTRFETAA